MSSVFETQKPVHRLQHQIHELEQRVERLKARLAQAVETHREQIRVSLSSKLPEEQQAAERIARFWEVPLPE